jgi:hypothetical protein
MLRLHCGSGMLHLLLWLKGDVGFIQLVLALITLNPDTRRDARARVMMGTKMCSRTEMPGMSNL